jgi:FAD/FMN-containing dehydrogenase
MNEPLDRRAFLAAFGAAAASVALGGCGGTARAASTESRASTATSPGRRPPHLTKPSKSLAQSIRGPVITPGSPGYASASHVYNETFDWVKPQAIARPLNAADVQSAVRWAVSAGAPLRARSGGHSYAGYSTVSNGVVLDLRNLNSVTVDRASGTATIGAGSQLIDVYTKLAAHGATIPAGSCPSVGIGGHALGGGMGLAGRHFGLATDNIVAGQIVTADGRLHTVNAGSDPDLLWGLRGGGGGNFGVVTELTMRLHPTPSSVAYFFIDWPWSSASEALQAWTSWMPHATSLATSILHVNAGGGANSITVSGQYFGSSSALASVLAPMRAVPGASITTGEQNYLGLMMRWAGCLGTSLPACHTVGAAPGGTLQRAKFDAKSDYVARAFGASAAQAVVRAAQTRASLPGSGALLFDSYGGAINQVHPNATAFVHRNQLCCIQYLSYGGPDSWLQQTWQSMRPYVSGTAYQNYIDPKLTSWRQAYYGANYARLESIRKTVDPHHYFNFPQAIGR